MKTMHVVLCFLAMSFAGASANAQWTFVQAGEARLHVLVEGSGPTLILLPGQGRGPRVFDRLTYHLVQNGVRAIRFEPRGYGESRGPLEGLSLRDHAKDVAAVIEGTSSAPAVVAGWAFGNRVARMLATDRPNLVRGLVLIAAGGKFPPAPEVVQKQRMTRDRSLSLEQRAAIGREIFFGPNSNVSTDDMQLDEVSPSVSRSQNLTASTQMPVDTWWSGGTAKMLVLQGAYDVIAPPQNGRSLLAQFPDRVKLKEFSDLGHGMVRERPDLIANEILSWMREIQ
jgi:pimeloyl-ACP methyl ester carboxylesterase